jgi:ABC-2 type transport system permease protein
MNTESNAVPESPPPAVVSTTRPMVWSVRRELWENRSIVFAPLIAAGVILFGFAISTVDLADRTRAAMLLEPIRQHALISMPYSIAAILIMLTTLIVAMFYCLDALHSERRDRSILFWKSMPVSDLVTVLSKASIPLVILPLIAFAIAVATQFIMLLWSTVVLLASDVSAATLWTHWPVFHESLVLLYGLMRNALWFAPIYGWLLLVSGWAQRSTFLWAVLPPLAVGVFEKLAFDTTYILSLLKFRMTGGYAQAFVVNVHEVAGGAASPHGRQMRIPDAIPDPIGFLSSPDVWLGLAAAAAFVAAAIWMRRYRDPI